MNSRNSGLDIGNPDCIWCFISDYQTTFRNFELTLSCPIKLANSKEYAYISVDKIIGWNGNTANPIITCARVTCDQVSGYNSNAGKTVYHCVLSTSPNNYLEIREQRYIKPKFYRLDRTENDFIDKLNFTLIVDGPYTGLGNSGRINIYIRLCKGGEHRPYTRALKRIKNGV